MAAPHATLANPLAPWAEIVPNMPPMTTDELRAIPDDGWAYELVEGVLVRMPLNSFGASNIGSRLPNLTEKAHGFSRVDESAPFTRVSAPDLAVEVAPENQFAPGMEAKARTYLTFGTRLVWVIGPRYKRVDVWQPGHETPTPLGVDDTLDGKDVVPGFTYPIARLFP